MITAPSGSEHEPFPAALADPHPVAPNEPGTPDLPDTGRDTDRVAPGGLRAHIARASPDATVISLAGEVDIATADVFATALSGAVSAGAGGRIVLELNRVSFLAAHGLSVIAAAHTHAPHRGATVVLVVDQAAPAAATLRFLPAGQGPTTYSTLSAALMTPGRP